MTIIDDIVAICSLTDSYSAAANRLYFNGMADISAIEGEIVALGNIFHGRRAIAAVFRQTIKNVEVMNQICSGGAIDGDGDRASVHWTVTDFSNGAMSTSSKSFSGIITTS